MHINPNLFFLAKPPVLVAWNYKTHTQFEIDSAHAGRLLELINDITSFNHNNALDHALFITGLIQIEPDESELWGWDILSRIFHIGTKDLASENQPQNAQQWAQDYVAHCDDAMNRPFPRPHRLAGMPIENMIALPPPLPNPTLDINNSLTDTLFKRKTCRKFLHKGASLEDMSTLLHLSFGYLKERENDTTPLTPKHLHARRSSPSGGGLNSCEAYLYAYNIKNLNPGIYYYHPALHAIRLVQSLNSSLGSFMQGQHFVNDLAFGIFLTVRLDKLWWKYEHSRAYRVALLEAGHLSQTFQLTATALGFNTWLSAAMNDSQVEKVLGIKDMNEQVLLFTGGGYSNGAVFCDQLIQQLTPH